VCVLQHRRSERVTKRQKYVDDLQLDISDDEKGEAEQETGIVMQDQQPEVGIFVIVFIFASIHDISVGNIEWSWLLIVIVKVRIKYGKKPVGPFSQYGISPNCAGKIF